METDSKKKHKLGFFLILIVDAILLFFALWQIPPVWPNLNFVLLEPKGVIASQQKSLMVAAVLLMLIATVPAYVFIFIIPKKYKAENKADYVPDYSNKKLTFLIWALPSAVILIISAIIWTTTHELDPYRPIESNVKPLTIQVIALRWKWLFIYPEQNIATINYIQVPVNRPLNFELTADGPMSTFWIPQLGGQIYTMAAMETKLHLMATRTGEYFGQSSEISGDGYSGMRFIAKVVTPEEFDQWTKLQKSSSKTLSEKEYARLLELSMNNKPVFYAAAEENLFNNVIMKYMSPVSK